MDILNNDIKRFIEGLPKISKSLGYELTLSNDKVYGKLIGKFGGEGVFRNNNNYKDYLISLLENIEEFINNSAWKKALFLGYDIQGGVEAMFDSVSFKKEFVKGFLFGMKTQTI